jgi:hypothetical protein
MNDLVFTFDNATSYSIYAEDALRVSNMRKHEGLSIGMQRRKGITYERNLHGKKSDSPNNWLN